MTSRRMTKDRERDWSTTMGVGCRLLLRGTSGRFVFLWAGYGWVYRLWEGFGRMKVWSTEFLWVRL